MIITVNDVYYSYKAKSQTVYAVQGISCTFRQGQFYAIVGKSGSGKTTFMSLLAGLDLPEKGDILFDNVSIRKLNCDALRRDQVSVIYQNYNLFPLLTAAENVMYPMLMNKIPKKEARKIAIEKMEQVGLNPALFNRFPAQISGGEQQRVAIARALASGSKIILADEPTGNLDSGNSRHVVEILKRLAKEKEFCVIVVTHDDAVAGQADVVLHMQDGTLKNIL